MKLRAWGRVCELSRGLWGNVVAVMATHTRHWGLAYLWTAPEGRGDGEVREAEEDEAQADGDGGHVLHEGEAALVDDAGDDHRLVVRRLGDDGVRRVGGRYTHKGNAFAFVVR